jgi:riboflavin synthase
MFTGIIETIGTVHSLRAEGANLHIEVASSFTQELKIDQSVAHNGVCLTVVSISDDCYTVTAIKETLDKTSLSSLQVANPVNLERGMKLSDRLDGHIVQGHVDQVAQCTNVLEENGSWKFTFKYDSSPGNITIEKGSITINGVSLSVAIIPYTYKHTTFNTLKEGTVVNLEFDVIGKYVARLTQLSSQ